MTIPDGTYAAFGSVLNLNMEQFGLSGDAAAWLGCMHNLFWMPTQVVKGSSTYLSMFCRTGNIRLLLELP